MILLRGELNVANLGIIEDSLCTLFFNFIKWVNIVNILCPYNVPGTHLTLVLASFRICKIYYEKQYWRCRFGGRLLSYISPTNKLPRI